MVESIIPLMIDFLLKSLSYLSGLLESVLGGLLGAIISLVVAGKLKEPKIELAYGGSGVMTSDGENKTVYKLSARNKSYELPILKHIRRRNATCTLEYRVDTEEGSAEWFLTGGWRGRNSIKQLQNPKKAVSISDGGYRYFPIAVKEENSEEFILQKETKNDFVDGQKLKLEEPFDCIITLDCGKKYRYTVMFLEDDSGEIKIGWKRQNNSNRIQEIRGRLFRILRFKIL